MSALNPAVLAWFGSHHGVATRARLLELGIGRHAISTLHRQRTLVTAGRGVYVLAGSPATLEQRCLVTSLAHPSAYITGPTAGMLAGLRRMPPSAAIHAGVRHGINVDDGPGITWRQTTKLRRADRVRRADGIWVAAWPRLAFDLAADLRQLDHQSVVHQLLDQRRVTRTELSAIGGWLCHPARRGSTTFARTLATIDDRAAHDSHAEVSLADALRARGVPVQPQVPLTEGQVRIHLDLGVPAVRWGVELDIHPEHRTVEGQQRDALRRTITNAQRWLVEIVTELDLTVDPSTTVERLVASYRAHAEHVAAPRTRIAAVDGVRPAVPGGSWDSDGPWYSDREGHTRPPWSVC